MTKTTKISIRIVIMFVLAILVSYICDFNHEFLGDTYCTEKYCNYGGVNHYLPTWHYGLKHWLVILMGTSLLFVQSLLISGIITDSK